MITAIMEKHINVFKIELEKKFKCDLKNFECPDWLKLMKFKYILNDNNISALLDDKNKFFVDEKDDILAYITDKNKFIFAKVLKSCPNEPKSIYE
jgi:hypothetical protein